VLSVSPDELLKGGLNSATVLYGIALGGGEAALGGLLCYTAIRLTPKLGQAGTPRRWPPAQHSLLRTPGTLSLLGTISLFEETTLRAAFVTAGLPLGASLAVICAVAVSLLAQSFPTGHKGATAFALIGTLVSAPVHASLFAVLPDVRPLVVAQFTITILNRPRPSIL
jgi:hypothetical protein